MGNQIISDQLYFISFEIIFISVIGISAKLTSVHQLYEMVQNVFSIEYGMHHKRHFMKTISTNSLFAVIPKICSPQKRYPTVSLS